MKKENRKLAQERRAAERAAKEKKKKLKLWIPGLLITVLASLLMIAIAVYSRLFRLKRVAAVEELMESDVEEFRGSSKAEKDAKRVDFV